MVTAVLLAACAPKGRVAKATPAEPEFVDGPGVPNAMHHVVDGLEPQVIKGTSHWPQLDKPSEFAALVDEFLATL